VSSSSERNWSDWWRTSGRDALTCLLAQECDPIFRGISFSSPEDEYADSADQIGAKLRLGSTAEELATLLIEAETAMHLQPDDHDRSIDLDVARTIIAWYERASPADAD